MNIAQGNFDMCFFKDCSLKNFSTYAGRERMKFWT